MRNVINYVADKKEWEDAQTREFNKIVKKVRIDGFRPGKAPRAMVEKKYGADILIDAANSLIDREYRRIITEDKLVPVVSPKIELVKSSKEELEVNFTIITKPEVKLGEYKNLGVKKDEVKVTKKEIDKKVQEVLKDYTELVIKDDGCIASGDIAVIDFEGFKDGVAFDGGKGENYPLEIGSNTFIPGFEDGLIGMKKGEKKDLKLKFPDDYASNELKGAEVIFKVDVKEIKSKVIPELDKDFFEDLNMEGITNKSEFEEKIKSDIKEAKERSSEDKYISELLSKASDNMECDIDEEIILSEAEAIYNDMIGSMANRGVNEQMYLKYAGTTKEDIIEHLKTEASTRVKNSYLLNAIIDKEHIEVSDDEVNKEVKEMALKYDLTEKEFISNVGGLETLRYDLMVRRAIDIMKGNE